MPSGEPTPHLPFQPTRAQEELRQREPVFHRPEHGTSGADYERMTDAQFWEVGASGRIYTRDYVLQVLEERARHPEPEMLEVRDFLAREISPGIFLVTYTLLQPDRISRRSSLWHRTDEGWKILYHQGTLAEKV